jgi:hypothetical protein
MITVRLHAEGEILDHDLPLDRISDALAAKHSLVWADVVAPTNEDLSLLEEEFGFHALALEDASLVHERPKVDEYDRFLLIIFYAISGSEGAAAIELEQISIFAGANFVVTMHGRDLPMLDLIGHRWQANHARIGIHGAGLLVYSILDALVDGYLPVIDQVSDRIDAIEDSIFGRFESAAQQEIFQLKRDLLQMRRVLTPERDVLNRDRPLLPGHLRPPVARARLGRHLPRPPLERARQLRLDPLEPDQPGHENADGLVDHPDDDDAGGRNLRHELRAHARVELANRLPVGPGGDGGDRPLPRRRLQAQGVVLTRFWVLGTHVSPWGCTVSVPACPLGHRAAW